jgi:hypothetical protein
VLEFDIGRGALVRGVVLDSSAAPARDCQVVLLRTMPGDDGDLRYIGDGDVPSMAGAARTDDAGRFELAGVSGGTYRLGTMSRDDACADVAERIAVPSSGSLDVTMSRHPGLSITGLTLSPAGSPEWADVELRGIDIDVSMSRSGFGDHRFSFERLVVGRYRLRAGGDRYHAASEWVDVEAGARDVVLRLTAGATIRGTLHDSGGSAIEKASVAAIGEDGDVGFQSELPLPDFELTGVSAGYCVVTATTPDGRIATSQPIEVARGAKIEGVRLQLERAAALDVGLPGGAVLRVVVELDGRPIAVEVEAFGRAVLLVPPRELEVRAEFRGNVVARASVAARAGETLKVDLRGE